MKLAFHPLRRVSLVLLLLGSSTLVAPPLEKLDLVLVRDGKPLHNMICLPNDLADPAAVLALKEYRVLIKRATGVEPLRVDKPEAGRPTIFFGRNPWSERAGITTNADAVLGQEKLSGNCAGAGQDGGGQSEAGRTGFGKTEPETSPSRCGYYGRRIGGGLHQPTCGRSSGCFDFSCLSRRAGCGANS